MRALLDWRNLSSRNAAVPEFLLSLAPNSSRAQPNAGLSKAKDWCWTADGTTLYSIYIQPRLCKMCVRGSKKVQNDGADWLREEYLKVQGWALSKLTENMASQYILSSTSSHTGRVSVCGGGVPLDAPFNTKCSFSSTETEKGSKMLHGPCLSHHWTPLSNLQRWPFVDMQLAS